jgi:hypothetical protein
MKNTNRTSKRALKIKTGLRAGPGLADPQTFIINPDSMHTGMISIPVRFQPQPL